jgi:hypothetical protein
MRRPATATPGRWKRCLTSGFRRVIQTRFAPRPPSAPRPARRASRTGCCAARVHAAALRGAPGVQRLRAGAA